MSETPRVERRIEIVRSGLISNQQLALSGLMYSNQIKDAWVNAGDELLKSTIYPNGAPKEGEPSSIENTFSDVRGDQIADATLPGLLEPLWSNIDDSLRAEGFSPLTPEERKVWQDNMPEVFDHTQLEDVPKLIRDSAYDKALEGVGKLAELAGEAAKEYYRDNAPALEKFLDDLIEGVKDGVQKGVDEAQELGDDISDALEKAWNDMGDKLDEAKDALGGLWDDLVKEPAEKLLDKLKDLFRSAELAMSPLILDLDGDGVETINRSEGIHFDHDGNGLSETTGWVGRDDGLLVFDKNGDGQITSGGELFGNFTKVNDTQTASHGFQALSLLDENDDGVISAADSAFSQLKIWKDSNSNAIVDSGELLFLAELQIKSLGLAYTGSSNTDLQGNQHLLLGNYTKDDDTSQSMNDVWFAVDTARTKTAEILTVDDDTLSLPDVTGFGNVHSLHQAIARDETGGLKQLVKDYLSADDADRASLIDELIFVWVGRDDLSPVYNSNGRLDIVSIAGILEAFLNDPYNGGFGQNASFRLMSTYQELTKFVHDQIVYSGTDAFYEKIDVYWDKELQGFSIDIEPLLAFAVDSFERSEVHGVRALEKLESFLTGHGELGGNAVSRIQEGYTSVEILAHYLPFFGAIGSSVFGQDSSDHIQLSDGKSAAYGFAGDDTIVSESSNSTLLGGDGNDTITDINGSDTIEGGDGDDVITDQGSGTNTLRGGNGDDTITFSRNASNTVEGGAGNDTIKVDTWNYTSTMANTISGGTGNDTITGGYGAETYLFNRGDGQDSISEVSGADKLVFGEGISIEQFWFRRSNADLEVSVLDADDKVTIKNWYSGTSYRVEQFIAADGMTLLDSQVQSLVDAMASFGVPPGSETSLSSDQRAQLDVVIAANWQ